MIAALKAIARHAGLRREHIAALRMYGERRALAVTRVSRNRRGGRILCYHSIGQPAMGVNDVTPAQFRRQIEIALQAGYRFVPAGDIARHGGKPDELAITFDDGFTSLRTHAAPILREHGIPWSVFVVSDWAEGRHAWAKQHVLPWGDLGTLAAGGVELGSHSVTHPDFGRITLPQMRDELYGSREMFEKRLGFAPPTFAIPFGQSMNWPASAHQAAKDAGYEIIYAQAEETRPAGTVARTFVTAFDHNRQFNALLRGAFDRWEEWY